MRQERGSTGSFRANVRPLSTSWSIFLAALCLNLQFANASVVVDVIEDTDDHTVIEVSIDRVGFVPVVIDGVEYVEISLGDESPLKRVGAPELPTVARSLIIPAEGRMATRVLDYDFHEIPDIDVAPSRGILLRTVDPADVPYEFGDEYGLDDEFPGDLVALREPYILRDHRGIVVEVFPLQYNPGRRTLKVIDRITVEVSRVGPGGANELHRVSGEPSAAFHRIYSHHFVNHEGRGGRYAPLNESGEMLIIADDSWLSNVQPLVDHKNSIGIATTAVGVGTIGNNASSIENYLRDLYDSSDLAFVLLVGDSSQVASPNVWGSAADPTYATVGGNDSYPDILVGRFSAENASQVDTQVDRTIEYEELPATTQSWFTKGIGIGSEEGPGDDNEYDWEHIDNIRDDLLGYGYTEVDQFYGYSTSASQVRNALNEGRGIVNYCGHGWDGGWVTSGFSNSDVNGLTNSGRLPFVITVGCNVGEFNHGTCFAESWLRASSGGSPTGAIAFYGSTISQSWDPPMSAQDEVNDLLVAEAYVSFGALAFGGACRMMDEYGGSGADEFTFWHVFGDPSLRVSGVGMPAGGLSVDPGEGFIAEGSAGGPFTPSEWTYTLTNNGDHAIDYTVTHGHSWLSVSAPSGTLSAGGSKTVTISIDSSASTLGNGTYEDTLEFVNATDHEGDTSRTADLTVGVPTIQYAWNLNDDPGWTVDGDWALGEPAGSGGEYGSRDPTDGFTGHRVYGYNLSGDYPNEMAEKHLTTTAIDCSFLAQVTLRFWRWLGVESSEYDHAYVKFSTDGQSWSTVWQNTSEIADDTWTPQEFDISAIADGEPTVYVRWTMGSTDEGWRYCGWNIDDIEILGMGDAGCWDDDLDGYLSQACGGDDCEDGAYAVHPNAQEVCADGIDNDCNGAADAMDETCSQARGEADTDAHPAACSCRVTSDVPSPSGVLVLPVGWLAAVGIRRRMAAAQR